MARVIKLGMAAVGNVNRIQFTLTKDGQAWTTIESVTLTFIRPNRTKFSRSMIRESGAIWYYDTTTSDLNVPGTWTFHVAAVEGSIVKSYPYEISMAVIALP